MSKRSMILIVLTLIITLGLYLLDLSCREQRVRVLVKGLEDKIKQAHLMDADPHRVLAFLDNERISHTRYERDSIIPEEKRTISGRIEGVARMFTPTTGPIVYDITIIFRFNENDKGVFHLGW